MELRRLGTSDLYVSPVIFGAWAVGGWNWGGTDDDAAVEAIRASIDAGVTAIDTAPVYGRGHSERVVGRAIRGRRDQVTLLTKVGLRWDDYRGAHFFDAVDPDGTEYSVHCNLRPDSIFEEVDRSLRRLGVDHIDLLQVHWPDPTTPLEETMDALSRVVERGKARAIGVSNFNLDKLQRTRGTLADLARLGRPAASTSLASLQPPYSLLTRGIEDEVLPWCRRNNVGVIVYSPLERGLLTGMVGLEREFPTTDGRSDDPLFAVENRRKLVAPLRRADEIARLYDCTLAQLAAAWCFHRVGITAAIVGARDARQARENAAAASLSLSEEHVGMLRDLFADLDLDLDR